MPNSDSNEAVTAKFSIHYRKNKIIPISDLASKYVLSEEDMKYEYNPFVFSQFQQYNPLYSLFFQLNETNYNHISLNHRYSILNADTLFDHSANQIVKSDVHFKYSPLLDPIHYLVGKYNLSEPTLKTLPQWNNTAECFPKLTLSNNVSYVDAFFCYLTNQLLEIHQVQHGLRYYGSYLGIQKVFKFNASDDFDFISSSDYFSKHLGKEFYCDIQEHSSFANFGSRGNKDRLNIDDDNVSLSSAISILTVEPTTVSPHHTIKEEPEIETEISEYQMDIPGSEEQPSYIHNQSNENNENDYCDSEISYTTIDDDDDDDETEPTDREDNNMESSEENDEDEKEDTPSSDDDDNYDDETDETEPIVNVYIRDYPVQMICQEKCEGTMDELFMLEEIDETKGAAYLFQIIMTLLVYQRAFHFTHNDLHTNNIMYVSTPHKFLYYRFSGKIYRVPTYGKIFKLIDFGRAWYSFRGQTLFSDCFMGYGDANTQYNCEPFFDPKHQRVEPNLSFDLCRLGCSIYNFIIGEENIPDTNMDEFQKTVLRWCTDDEGKNVLYKKNGKERYPGFKLYKMIARTVHQHTPTNQLKYKYYSQFEYSPKKMSEKEKTNMKKELVDIDGIPSYV
jgi:hypothetical protein